MFSSHKQPNIHFLRALSANKS